MKYEDVDKIIELRGGDRSIGYLFFLTSEDFERLIVLKRITGMNSDEVMSRALGCYDGLMGVDEC